MIGELPIAETPIATPYEAFYSRIVAIAATYANPAMQATSVTIAIQAGLQ
jgi:hypothetical protein